ncbi:MAG: hypothetical protein AAGG46_08535 [Planctomycetota bacterium]
MLKLQLKATDPPPLELDGFTPNAFASATADAVRSHRLWVGNTQVAAAELFDIDGDPTDGAWRFEGDLSRVHRLGEGMTAGEVRAAGPVGEYAGARMKGGRLSIQGDTGNALGAEMRGGSITVHGNAGGEVGVAMRRGLITVAGDAGPFAGYRMRAGTVLILGEAGPRAGAEMFRGTVGLLGEAPPTLLPTFRYACDFEPVWLRAIARECGVDLPATVSLFSGDLLTGGRGEMLTRCGESGFGRTSDSLSTPRKLN